MATRLSLPRLKKYDVGQKVIEALADVEARSILFSTVRRGRTAAELSDSLGFPLSSVYKKLGDLSELTLIEVEKELVSKKGRNYKVYRSRVRSANISITRMQPRLTLVRRR